MRPALAALLAVAALRAGPDTLRLEVEPLPSGTRALVESATSGAHVVVQPGRFTWCPQIVQVSPGNWRLIHSRWPSARGFLGWLTFSEVALASAAVPEGPFADFRTLVPAAASGESPWFDAHNPKVLRHEGRWWLWFIRTRAANALSETLRGEVALRGYAHPLWGAELRPNQRVFHAEASDLEGPWSVAAEPILQPSGPIATLVVNPAPCARADGGLLMVVKGDRPGERRFIRNQAVALADHPAGPWRLEARPVIGDLDTEDMSVWRDRARGRYYGVFHSAAEGGFIGLVTSEDGRSWTRAGQFRLTDKVLRFADGSAYRPSMMERPFVLTDDEGAPTHLAVACGLGETTGIVILRLTAR